MAIMVEPGTNFKAVRIVSRNDMLNADIAREFMFMIQDYVKEAQDIATTPEETWKVIRDSVIQGDLQAILIAHWKDSLPQGFMYCRIDDENPDTAVIHCAYSKSEIPASSVDQSLVLFEDWARFNRANKGRFYTFRMPGAHKTMMKRGWKHVITSYKKEI